MNKQKIAVIGSGVSGLSAAWLLSKSHDVTLYEAGDYLGGHTNTVDVETFDGSTAVDTGFIVYNEPNYPNLTAMFDHLGVASHHTDMSFSYSVDGGHYEYSGSGANGFFGQRRNVLNRDHWQQLGDMMRFFKTAPERVTAYNDNISLGDYLSAEKFSPFFIDNHVIPMGAAIWSTDAKDMMAYPAKTFIDFYANHALLKIKQKPDWRSVIGGGRTYVQRLVEDGDFEVELSNPVKSVTRKDNKVLIDDSRGTTRIFDQVVLATHADISLKLLGDADEVENGLLQHFPYQYNKAVLHSDKDWMPQRKRLWSCWNYIKNNAMDEDRLCVTYWMNELQELTTEQDLFVTLNPTGEIDPDQIYAEFDYMHPVFDAAAIEAQRSLWSLQGRNNTWFCGAYFGYGFHEDGLQSGLAVAEQLGGLDRPWKVQNPSGRIHVREIDERVAAE